MTNKLNQVLALVLTMAALMTGQTAWADDVTLSEDSGIPVGTAGHWYVNLPYHNTNKLTLSTDDLAAGKNVFKVYDDGGKNGNYSENISSYLSITIPEGYGFYVTGTVCTDAVYDYLRFSAGESYYYITSSLRSDTDGEVKSIKPVILSNNSVLWIIFNSFIMPIQYAGIDLTVTIVGLNTDFSVNKSTLSHGTLAVDKTRAKLGETVIVTPTPSANYSTAEVSYTVGTTKYVIESDNGTYSFTMPAGDVTVSAKFLDEVGYLWGEDADGTAENPYVISNKAGWDLLVTKSTSSSNITQGKYFELEADISGVTQSVLFFGGHLDGKGHKITLAMNNIGYGLIWRVNNNCYISNLTVDGSIVNQEQYVGGFIAQPSLSATFTNCRSSVAITSSYSGDDFKGGGFVGFTGGYYITVDGCVFDGSFSSSNNLTFSPWVGGIHHQITNSAYLYGGEAHFYNGVGYSDIPAYHLTLNNYATVVRTGGTAIGNDTGAVYYISGFTLDGNEYYMPNSTVTLGCNLPDGYSLTGYSTSTGYTFTDNTFKMSGQDITVTACIVPTDYVTHWQASMTIDGSSADKAYVITTTQGLDLLANEVNGGNTFDGTFFRLDKDITYSYETAWNDDNSNENNFAIIGTLGSPFCGTFDGKGKTISGLRIWNNSYDIGLFGDFGTIGEYGTVKNIVLADARITGYMNVGGIAGKLSYGTVSGCTVKSNVTVFATKYGSSSNGGIVGNNAHTGTVSGCTSSAHVIYKGNGNSIGNYGGIVGDNNGTVSGCTAAGVVISAGTTAGAIVGNNDGTLSGNTYHSSLVGTDAFNIGVGKYYTGTTTYTNGDQTGATLDNSQLWLFDNRDNTALIAAYKTPSQHVAYGGTNYPSTSKSYTVTLDGRTLYKDGAWNTLTLPFEVSTSNGPLSGDNVKAMVLDGDDSGLSGTTLTLNFNEAPATIPAGTPFIVKWDKPTGYDEAPEDFNLASPVFTGVTVSSKTPTSVNFTGGSFRGTYGPVTLNGGDKSNLYLGSNNTLHWPSTDKDINAFRAYFHVDGGSVSAIKLYFGDDETTSLSEELRVKSEEFATATEWYTLSGVRLNAKPTQKGVYIVNGKKRVIK